MEWGAIQDASAGWIPTQDTPVEWAPVQVAPTEWFPMQMGFEYVAVEAPVAWVMAPEQPYACGIDEPASWTVNSDEKSGNRAEFSLDRALSESTASGKQEAGSAYASDLGSSYPDGVEHSPRSQQQAELVWMNDEEFPTLAQAAGKKKLKQGKSGKDAVARTSADGLGAGSQGCGALDVWWWMEPLSLAGNQDKCNRIMPLLSPDGAEKERVLAWLGNHVLALALAPCSCRVVQRLLEVLAGNERDWLMVGLFPHVVELYESPHGNHVLTKAIEVLPRQSLLPVVAHVEQKGVVAVARHAFGCRVLERLIEHGDETQMCGLIDVIVQRAEELARHQYGNFVVQHLLEHGSSRRRTLVLDRLLPSLPHLSMHRTATHVVQQALNTCSAQGQHTMAQALLQAEGAHSLLQIAASRYGSYVVEEMFNLFGNKGPGKEAHARLEKASIEHWESPAFQRVAGRYGLQGGAQVQGALGVAADFVR